MQYSVKPEESDEVTEPTDLANELSDLLLGNVKLDIDETKAKEEKSENNIKDNHIKDQQEEDEEAVDSDEDNEKFRALEEESQEKDDLLIEAVADHELDNTVDKEVDPDHESDGFMHQVKRGFGILQSKGKQQDVDLEGVGDDVLEEIDEEKGTKKKGKSAKKSLKESLEATLAAKGTDKDMEHETDLERSPEAEKKEIKRSMNYEKYKETAPGDLAGEKASNSEKQERGISDLTKLLDIRSDMEGSKDVGDTKRQHKPYESHGIGDAIDGQLGALRPDSTPHVDALQKQQGQGGGVGV